MRSLLALTALLVTSSAFADETIQHVVKKGDTCAKIAEHYYGDARLVEVLHKANPLIGNLPPPHNLKEGSIMIVPPRPASTAAPDAQLTTVRNQVEILAPAERPGKPKDPLFRGNRVSTEAASAADVTFRDETQVKLGERTLVVILGDAHAAAKEDAPVKTGLLNGNLRAFMSPKRTEPLAVVTPSSETKIGAGGEVKIDSDSKKTTRLSVYVGQSTLSAMGKTRDVGAGYGSKAELSKPPTVPRPLPPAPVWTTLPTRVLLDRGAGAPSIIGEYDEPPTPVTAATEFHVQFGRDAQFREILVDAKVTAATKRFEGRTPGPGHYWIRVSAIDNDQFEGPWGTTARTLIVSPKVTAEEAGHRRIELDPPDAACMRVGNVRLTWVKAPIVAATLEPVRLRCAPAEADPTTFIDMDRLDDFPSP